MKNKVIKTIEKHGLIKAGDRVLLALSGGSDSISLLYILNEIKDKFKFELFACHLNHSIRDEADGDERFVREICAKLGVECFVKKADVKAIAKAEKISEELAGRNERYAFFEEIMKKHDIDLVATAHNKNDVAETVLMHMMRGCGIDGMSGIPYKRDRIIRPLLDADKEEIEAFCRENNYKFVVDKTNMETLYTRNRIRHDLIPLIKREFNPNFIDTIAKNSAILTEDAEFLNGYAKRIYDGFSENGKISVSEFNKQPEAIGRRIILLMYKKYSGEMKNLQAVHVENILSLLKKAKSGTMCDIPGNNVFSIERDCAFFKKREVKKDYDYPLILDKDVYIEPIGISVRLKKWENEKEKFFFDDAEHIHIRNRRRGDIFYPRGMSGKKKLSDYFTDCKIPLSQREVLPIIAYKDEIAWIVGRRADRRFESGVTAYTFIIKEEQIF